MRLFVGIILGLFSAFLIYVESAMIFIDVENAETLPTEFVLVTFFGGWVVSTFLIVNGTRTVSKVFSRGFLIGAAEWLAMIPVALIFGAKAGMGSGETPEEAAGALIGGGIFGVLTGGIAIGMALVCVLGFVISHFLAREMRPEEDGRTKRCPACAELILAEARKCKHCGEVLVSEDS